MATGVDLVRSMYVCIVCLDLSVPTFVSSHSLYVFKYLGTLQYVGSVSQYFNTKQIIYFRDPSLNH